MRILFSSTVAILSIFSLIGAPIGINAKETQAVSSDNTTISQALTTLNDYANIQKSLKIQNPDVAYSMKKAQVMADLLIGTDGTLNYSLCPSVKSAFVPADPEDYEVDMGKVLDQLDASWQPFFDSVKAPADNSLASLVLRSLSGLDPSQPMTDRLAKVAVLGALLSPYNQGPVGDCFAVSNVLRDHDEYYTHAAEDCKSVIMHGYLDRLVNGSPDYFFFLPILADEDRDQSFNIAPSGAFPGTSYSLFDAPGFALARTLMGGNSITSLESDVMQQLSANAGQNLQVTPSQVITAMAQAIAGQTHADADELADVGEYAFSSLTNNLILRAVEAAFAAMAEDRSTDSTRGNINDCVMQASKSIWTADNDAFKQAFTTTFNASYRLLYNEDIPLAVPAADGSSTDGGFQLYKRETDPTLPGTRVATPQDFRNLILDAISASASDDQATASQFTALVKTDAFLREALWDYDPNNQKVAHPIPDYQKLSRTPMQSCDGDNPFEVADIDTGTTYDKDVQTYTPANMKDLITWCLNMAKTAPAEMIPMDSPQHSFNFMPTNPDLVFFTKAQVSAGQWIQKTLVIPGMQVAKRQIDADTKKAIADQMSQMLSQVLPDQSSYDKLVQSLASSNLTVQEYGQKLLDGINQILGSDANQTQAVTVAFDSVLLQCLPATDLSILEQSAIRFAFTNWNEGSDDIYFCAFFNPRSEQVAFGTIFEDKTNLSPMDENAWVNHQQWDVDLKPFAPVNTD